MCVLIYGLTDFGNTFDEAGHVKILQHLNIVQKVNCCSRVGDPFAEDRVEKGNCLISMRSDEINAGNGVSR